MGSPVLVQNFYSASSVSLESYAPTYGVNWVNKAGAAIVDSAGLRTNNASGATYQNSGSSGTGSATGNVTVSWTMQALAIDSGGSTFQLSLIEGSYGYFMTWLMNTGGGYSWNLYKAGSGGMGYVVTSSGDGSISINAGTPSLSCVWTTQVSGSSTIHTVTANGSTALSWTDNGSSYGAALQGGFILQWYDNLVETDTTGVRLNNLVFMDTGTVAAPDTNVVLSPATSYVVPGTSFSMEHNTQSVKFSFSGTSLLAQLNIANWIYTGLEPFNSYPNFLWSIDNGPWQLSQIQSSVFYFAAGLSNTTHQIEIILIRGGLTQYQNNYFNVTGWYLDSGGTISAPTSSSAKLPNCLAVFGDSITDGYASGAAFGSTSYSSPLGVLECYATICAKVIEAELGAAGYSGQGMIYTGNFPENLATTSQNYYSGQARVWPTGGNALTHIIMAEGTNDIGLVESASITAQTMETTIVTQMEYFRTNNPTAMIILLVPSTVNYAGTSPLYASAFAQYQAANPNDTNILLADPTTQVWAQGFSGSTSPTPYSKYGYSSVHGNMQWHILLGSWLGSLINSTTAALNGGSPTLNATGNIVFQQGNTTVTESVNYTPNTVTF